MTATPKTAARLFLDALGDGGVDYVFANAGTDFAPILEALLEHESDQVPEFVICPHENLAVAMAHGFFLASGKAQGVMVHVNVGVANALCGLLNAARDNIPMLFASGRTPITEQGRLGSRDNFIHWGQEMFDQGAMLREFVKWDYELRCPEQTSAAVGRALSIARSEPAGPVYLSLPREVLAATANSDAPQNPAAAASSPAPDPAAIDRVAHLAAAAKSPLLITARAGRTARGVAALSTLAEKFAIPVVEAAANYMCLPGDHPMHAGFTPAPYLPDADLIIVVDAPVPWTPSRIGPSEDCPVIQIGPDPLFEPLPFRGFRSDIAIKTETAAGLEALLAAVYVSKYLDQPVIDARRKALAPKLADARAKRLAKAATPGAKITHDYASHCLNQALGKDGVLVNERGCLREAMEFTEPGTFFGPTIAGGLGASIGIALGIKLAAPERMVAAALGDGSCIFNNPVACLQTAVARQLPILIVVLNNEAWHSVKASTLQVYPDGAVAHSNHPPLTSLAPSPDYAGVAIACGAEGVRVGDPAALQQVLHDAVTMVRKQSKTMLVDIAIAMN
jgi:acetolactate synthase I/II/III large subunit